jgi:AraC-like DNA-binding protein
MSCTSEAIDLDVEQLNRRSFPVAGESFLMGGEFRFRHELTNTNEVRAQWGCLSIRWLSARSGKKIEINARSVRPQLIVMLESTGCDLQAVSTPEYRSCEKIPRHLSVVAPDDDVWLCSQGALHFRCVIVEFDSVKLKDMVGISCAAEDLFRTQLMFVSHELLTIGELIAFECLRERKTDSRYTGALASTLVLGLARAKQNSPEELRKGGLSPWQLRRVTVYLEENLQEGTSLKALSNLIGLSQHHFARAFKVSTGVAPLEWLRAARVRHAQARLVDGTTPLAQIASEAGFADQAHMTRVFRDATGETPGVWRRRHVTVA